MSWDGNLLAAAHQPQEPPALAPPAPPPPPPPQHQDLSRALLSAEGMLPAPRCQAPHARLQTRLALHRPEGDSNTIVIQLPCAMSHAVAASPVMFIMKQASGLHRYLGRWRACGGSSSCCSMCALRQEGVSTCCGAG